MCDGHDHDHDDNAFTTLFTITSPKGARPTLDAAAW